MQPENIAVVLLAAGTSSRFGDDDKLMANLDGKPVAFHAMETIATLGFAERIAVVRPIELAPELHRRLATDGFTILVNDRPDDGMSGSIVRAIDHVFANAAIDGVLICLADMPRVLQSHLTQICLAATDIRSVVASRNDNASSPPAFIGRAYFPELRTLQGDTGARALLRTGIQVRTSSAILKDIDTRADLPG